MSKRTVARPRSRARHPSSSAPAPAQRVQRQAKKVVTHPWVQRAARFGYVVRGLIYATMGLLAFGLAIGRSSDPADQRGTLELLGNGAVARVLLLVVAVSLTAYAGWGFIRAIYDPLHRGDDVSGIASRIGFAWSGLNYLALAIFAVGAFLGSSKTSKSDSVQQIVGWALNLPAGGLIITIAGLIGIAGGIGQFVDAYKAGFRKDLKRNRMTRWQRVAVDGLGRFGMVARGVIFGTVGIFVFEAGLHHDPSDAHSFGPAFVAVAREPMGHLLLGIVALGFVALGLHSWANARWVRMPAG